MDGVEIPCMCQVIPCLCGYGPSFVKEEGKETKEEVKDDMKCFCQKDKCICDTIRVMCGVCIEELEPKIMVCPGCGTDYMVQCSECAGWGNHAESCRLKEDEPPLGIIT